MALSRKHWRGNRIGVRHGHLSNCTAPRRVLGKHRRTSNCSRPADGMLHGGRTRRGEARRVSYSSTTGNVSGRPLLSCHKHLASNHLPHPVEVTTTLRSARRVRMRANTMSLHYSCTCVLHVHNLVSIALASCETKHKSGRVNAELCEQRVASSDRARTTWACNKHLAALCDQHVNEVSTACHVRDAKH